MAEFKLAIDQQNLRFAYAELDFTHDYSSAKVGSVFVNRHGASYTITAIDKDSAGRKQYWCGNECLATQYTEPHNMLTKSAFFAYRFKIDEP